MISDATASDFMPEVAVVEKMYVNVLESMMMPSSTILKLIENETVEKKWEMVGMHSKLLGGTSITTLMQFSEKDKHLLDLLVTMNRTLKVPSHEFMQNLKLALRQLTKQWFDGFVKANGVIILLDTIKVRLLHNPMEQLDSVVLLSLLDCFKFLMKDAHGMTTVISTPGAISTIAMCLDFRWERVSLSVMEILSVTCFSSEEGHALVLSSLDRLFRQRMEKPFTSLVNAIAAKPMTTKVLAMTLINTLVNHAPSLDDRIRLRNYFASLDLSAVVENVLALPPADDLKDEGEADELRMSMIGTGLLDDNERKADPFGTNIAPHLGVMAGVCYSCDFVADVGKKRGGVFGGGTIKNEVQERWYGLSEHSLEWYKCKGGTYSSQRPEGRIELSEIINILPETMNGVLRSFNNPKPGSTANLWGFDVVCENKILSLGLMTEESRARWYQAIMVAWDYVRMKKGNWLSAASGNRAMTALDLDEYEDHQNIIEKQVEVFEAIQAADKEQTVMKRLLNIDAASFREVSDYVLTNLENDGVSDKLLDMMHQLILMPTSGVAGEEAWNLLLQTIKDIRGLKRVEIQEVKGDAGNTSAFKARKRCDWKIDYGKMESLVKAQQHANLAIDRLGTLETLVKKKDEEIKRLNNLPITENPQFIVFKKQFDQRLSRMNVEHEDPVKKETERAEEESKNKKQIEQLKKDVEEARKATPAAGGAPAPVAGGAPSEPEVRLKDDPRYAKYWKMLKMGLPAGAAAGRAIQDGVDASEIEAVLARDPEEIISGGGGGVAAALAPVAAPAEPEVRLKDGEYAKYFNMVKMGLPTGAAVGRAVQDGFDASEVEAVLARDPEEVISGGGGGGSAAAAPAAPANPMLAGITGGGGRGALLAGIGGGGRGGGGGGGGRGGLLAGIGAGRGGGGRGGLLAGIGAGRGSAAAPKKASVTEEDLGLKPKPKKEPTAKKMKSLFWSKVQPKSIAGTVWLTMQENANIDFKELENSFFDPAKEKAADGGGGGGGGGAVKAAEKPKKSVLISLIDPKRNQNVSIALARYKFDNDEFRRKVIAFSSEIVNLETISKIQMMAPADEEISMMNEFEGDATMLGKVEKFFLEMAKIPRLKQRLECASISLHFDENLTILLNKLEVYNSAVKEVKTSKSFLAVLEMVMAIGNHLNGGSDRGQAHGFKLDVLGKMTNMKSNDRKKGNLMNFLVKQVEKQRKTLLELPSELANLAEASTISLDQMAHDFKQLELSVKKVRIEVDKFAGMEPPAGCMPEDDAVTSFSGRFEPFLLKAEEACTRFSEGIDTMKMAIIANMDSFGDKIGTAEKFSPEKAQYFYTNLSNFVTAFTKAKEENVHTALAAEKDARRAKEVQNKIDKKVAKNEKKEDQKDLFSAFKEASSANTDDVVKEFQLRLAKKRDGRALANLP